MCLHPKAETYAADPLGSPVFPAGRVRANALVLTNDRCCLGLNPPCYLSVNGLNGEFQGATTAYDSILVRFVPTHLKGRYTGKGQRDQWLSPIDLHYAHQALHDTDSASQGAL